MPTTIGTYTISPEAKGWAVKDITGEEYTIHVVNTDKQSTVQLEVIPINYEYVENVTVFRPLPTELWQYITVTPEVLNLGTEESGDFTVHISFPDLNELYNRTWEYRLLFNDTNKYNFEDLGVGGTQKLHIVRIYTPLARPVPVVETPFYVYPFMIVFALIFLGGIVIYLRKRSVPLALRDHDSKGSEWAGMDIYTAEIKGQVPVMQTPVMQTVVAAPVRQPLVQAPAIVRSPVREPVREPVNVPVWKDVEEIDAVTAPPDKDRERKDRENARKREARKMKKLRVQQPATKAKRKAA